MITWLWYVGCGLIWVAIVISAVVLLVTRLEDDE